MKHWSAAVSIVFIGSTQSHATAAKRVVSSGSGVMTMRTSKIMSYQLSCGWFDQNETRVAMSLAQSFGSTTGGSAPPSASVQPPSMTPLGVAPAGGGQL